MLPLPEGIEFELWAALLAEEFSIEGIPVTLPWREFVDALQIYAGVSSLPDLPRHETFPDWRSWARRAMGVLA